MNVKSFARYIIAWILLLEKNCIAKKYLANSEEAFCFERPA